MENFFDLLDIETQNVIRACAEEAENEEINAFLELSCEDPNLMDFMFGGNDAYYTVENEFTRENRKFNCREKVIKLKASDRSLSSFSEAVEFCQKYIDSIHQNYIASLPDNTRIRTVIQHEEFDSAINFPFMRKQDLTPRLIFKEMDKVVQSRKNIGALQLEGDKRASISFIIAEPLSGNGKRKSSVDLPTKRIKKSDVGNKQEFYKASNSIKIVFKNL